MSQPPDEKPRHNIMGLVADYKKASREFMEEDLARSGLVPSDMAALSDEVNSEINKQVRPFVTASYWFPFYDLEGRVVDQMFRRRRRLMSGIEKHGVGKYTQPPKALAGGYGHFPYMPPAVWSMDSETLHICEGEKKTVALMKHAGVRAIGITGKDVGKDTVEVLVLAIEKMGVSRVCVWPDADVQRYDVRRSYGRLRHALTDALPGLSVDVIQPSWDTRSYKGIDDALAAGWAFEIGSPVGEELPIDMRMIADQIGLSYTVGEKRGFMLDVNSDNVTKILKHEPLWGQFAWNKDSGCWSVGSDGSYVDMNMLRAPTEILNRMQGILGMKTLTLGLVSEVLSYVCTGIEQSPWQTWLRGLIWDGKPRLSSWMARACGAQAGDEFVAEAGTKFLVSIVARTMKPGCAVDWMLITHGPQGCGKSSLPWVLLPEAFERLAMNAPTAHDKDLQAAANSCRILMFDEMAIFFNNNANAEMIKGFVTTRWDTYRPPYGRAPATFNRGSVLYGTTNRPDVIKQDGSGYRRWVVIDVKGVVPKRGVADQFDWVWLENEREQLWAEAVALYDAGCDYSQVEGATARAQAHVQDISEWDNFMAVLRAGAGNLALYHVTAEGHTVVYNDAFKLAYQDLWKREPRSDFLRKFWEHWGCHAEKGTKGRRRQILSERLWAVLNEPD